MSQTMAPRQTRNSHRHIRRSLGAAIAFVLAISSIAFLGPPANAAPDDPPTIVSLTFDDGNSDQLAAAAIMKSHGMPGTFYVNSGAVGMSGFLTLAQLNALRTDGHEIGGHTLNHTDLTTLPTEEARRQICLDRANLHAWGFEPRSFAYPFAMTSTAVRQLVQGCGYNSARNLGDIESRFGCAGCPNAESIPPSSPFETKALDQVDSTWTLQDFQDVVTNAEQSGGGWVQLTFHNFCGTVCGELSVSESVFTQFLDWLELRKASNNTSVKTVGDVIGGTVKPPVATPDPTPITDPSGLNNPGFETLNSSGIPMCWQQAGFGANTAAFSTVTPGRTGNRASRVTVTNYVDGDAKLLPSLDLGTCSPSVTAGKSYVLRGWYASTALTQFAVYLRTAAGGWEYWTSSPHLAASATFTQAVWTTPAIPAGYTGISFGLNLFSNGTLTTDDYSISATDSKPVTSAVVSPAVPDGLAGWYKTKPTVTLTLETGSAGAVRQYSYDGTAWIDYTAPIVVPDGTHTLSYRARTDDTVVEAARTLALKVDSTVPTVTPTFDKATRKVDATAADATSGAGPIQYREGSGAWGAFVGPITMGPAATNLEFRVTDAAGNVSAVAPLAIPAALISTDTVAPAAPDGLAGWYKTKPTVTLTKTSGAASAIREYSIDNGPWTAYATPIELSDGNVLRYRLRDGDDVEEAHVLTLKIDTVVPVVTPAFDKSTRKVSATATDGGSLVDRIEQRIGGGAWVAYTGAWVPSDAAQSIEFRAYDKAGNVSAVKTLSVPERHAASSTRLTISPSATTYGKRFAATVNVDVPAGEPAATGSVTLLADGKAIGSGTVVNGAATVSFLGALPVGTRSITAAYAGDATTKPSTSAPALLTIAKATPKVSFSLSSSKARAGKTRIKVKTVVSVPGTSVKPSGRLYVLVDGKTVGRATLSASRNGKLTITLPKFKSRMIGKKVKVSVKFAGSSNLKAVTSTKKSLRIRS